MKARVPQGYAVIFYETAEKNLKPLQENTLSDIQKQCLSQLKDDIKQRIYLGECAGIIDLEIGKAICNFNMENFRIAKHDIESLARTFLPSIQDFYSKEENQNAYEKWQAERDKNSNT